MRGMPKMAAARWLVLALALLDAAERQGIGTVTGPVGSLRGMR